MTDDAPPVVKLSEKRRLRVAGVEGARKRPQEMSGFSEYFKLEIEPALSAVPKFPPVNLGYPHLKRRR